MSSFSDVAPQTDPRGGEDEAALGVDHGARAADEVAADLGLDRDDAEVHAGRAAAPLRRAAPDRQGDRRDRGRRE